MSRSAFLLWATKLDMKASNGSLALLLTVFGYPTLVTFGASLYKLHDDGWKIADGSFVPFTLGEPANGACDCSRALH